MTALIERLVAETGQVPRTAAAEETSLKPKTLRERLRRPLLVAFPIALALGGAAEYRAHEPYVWTDDAFVRAAQDANLRLFEIAP